MKITALLLLFVFTSFFIAPTIVIVIKKNSDMSVFFSCADQEKADLEHEVVLTSYFDYIPNDFTFLNSSLILSENLSKQYKITSKIVILPPQQVFYIADKKFSS